MAARVVTMAMAMASAGFSVIPVRPEGKAPSLPTWTPYQSAIMAALDIEKNFNQRSQIGVVCGKVSGGLEVIDFDTAGTAGTPVWYTTWIQTVKQVNPELYEKLCVASTPSGGRHVFYQCPDAVEGNQKLASTDKGLVMIETRGNGGYVLVAPSTNYEWVLGDWLTIPVITPDERDLLFSVARALAPAPKDVVKWENTVRHTHEGRPGDRYNDETNVRDLLIEAGWVPNGKRNGPYEYWVRPGKDPRKSVSGAVITDGKPELFYCYTSSTVLKGGKCYSPFSLFVELKHNGNANKAAADAASLLGMKPKPGQETVQKAPKGSSPETLAEVFKSTPIGDFEDVVPEFGIMGMYIRAGQLNLLDAPGGSGKTTLVLSIAAAGSEGRDVISGDPIEPFKTLLFTTEDDPGELKKVYFEFGGKSEYLHVIERPIDLRGENLDYLKKKFQDEGFKLAVFDPLLTYMPGGANVNDPAAVNHFLSGIRRVAMETRTAVLAIRHFKKGAKYSDFNEMGAGSMQFRDTCRSQLVIVDHPDAVDERHLQGVKVVIHAKGSMQVARQPAFGYRLGANTGIFRPNHEYMFGVEEKVKPAKGGMR